jgi:rhomboid family GlyGly-CTERM serine protease
MHTFTGPERREADRASDPAPVPATLPGPVPRRRDGAPVRRDPWVAVAVVAALGALAGWLLPAAAIDWQPALAWRQPWRWWTAAFVHWSPLHLAANLAGAVLVGTFGRAAQVPPRVALAWLAAWPLAQLALLAQPALAHYGGLSGVLHAGVAAAACWLAAAQRGRRRAIGVAVLAALAAKVALERPWAAPLTHPPGWDIAVAPLAHAAGALAGLACTLAALALRRRPPRHRE